MGYTQEEMVVGAPLTPARKAFIREALRFYKVSAAGAEQFVDGKPVTDPHDRGQLLDFVNRVIITASGMPRGFRGKGRM